MDLISESEIFYFQAIIWYIKHTIRLIQQIYGAPERRLRIWLVKVFV